MSTKSTKIAAFQFLRLESYSNCRPFRRAGNGKKIGPSQRRWSANDLLDEACRVPKASNHVKIPQPPHWLFGSRETVEQCGNDWVQTTKYGERRVRTDSPWMVGGIASLPMELIEKWPDFRRACVEFLTAKFGDRLRAVVEHLDEKHPHVHFYLVPRPGEHFGIIHPGFEAQDAERRRTLGPGDKRRPVSRFNDAMRQLQDEFFDKVANGFGLMRVGANTGRKTRAEWKLQQATDDADRSRQLTEEIERKNEIESSRHLEMTMKLTIESLNMKAADDQLKKRRADLFEIEELLQKKLLGLQSAIEKIDVDFAYKRSQHFGPILSHLVKDKFAYSIVDKSTSLDCS